RSRLMNGPLLGSAPLYYDEEAHVGRTTKKEFRMKFRRHFTRLLAVRQLGLARGGRRELGAEPAGKPLQNRAIVGKHNLSVKREAGPENDAKSLFGLSKSGGKTCTIPC